MSEALEKAITGDQKIALASAISQNAGKLPARLDQVADQLGVSVADLAALLNDRSFLDLVRGLTKAQANLTFHNVAVSRLVDIATNGKDKQALAAIQTLGRITGDLTPRKEIDVKVSFDQLRKQSAPADDPLGGLFDIQGDVVDVREEIEEEDGGYERWEAGHDGA